ncbi:hypothetical protein KCP77_21250 [Salmonella enterica subsp. enterica]|nr:hypothetical protein KCP77_21250 [Salmonella enterica subsp. enterica]
MALAHAGRLFHAKQIPVEPVPRNTTSRQKRSRRNLKLPRAAPVRIYTNAEDLVGKRFPRLGEVGGESPSDNQDSPLTFQLRASVCRYASQMKANAVLLHSWQITSGTRRAAIVRRFCIGSPEYFGEMSSFSDLNKSASLPYKEKFAVPRQPGAVSACGDCI